MNKRIVIILLFFVLSSKGQTQNFTALPFTNTVMPSIDRVLTDTVHDILLASSRLFNYAGIKRVRGVCSWNETEWDSLTGGVNTHDYSFNPNNPNGIILGGIAYNGKFLVGGNFESIGGVNASNIATWDGTKWDSLPARAFRFLDYSGSVYDFAKYNNNLYLSGVFDSIQGQPANGLSTFDGTAFHPVSLPLYSNAYITCMAVYNGELYIAGVFTLLSDPSNRLILKYNGTNWVSVGAGVKGSSSSITSMVVFNNELYVGGYFLKSNGNAGNVVMKWDGSSWHDAAWGSDYNNGAIWKMLQHHNKLYAFGTFDLAGDKKASKIAVYDGQKWCTYSDSLDNNVLSATVYHDKIYISGGFKTINGDISLREVAKFSHPENFYECGVVGIKENNNDPDLIKLYPNPFDTELNIEFTGMNDRLKLSIYNSVGQLLYSMEQADNKTSVDLHFLNTGFYYLQVENNFTKKTYKIIKE